VGSFVGFWSRFFTAPGGARGAGSRDVSNVGHFGTGNLEITLSKLEDLQRAMLLLKRSYEDS
jgi:predicted transport protein